MAYALKYQINYKNILDVSCRIDIELDGYAGDVISVKGHGGNACTISHVNDNLDKYDPIIESKAEINLIQEGQIDIAELQTSADFDFRVRYFENGALEWEGFVIPDGIQDTYQATPYILSITATDGLNWLKGKEFAYGFAGQRNYLLYLRQIFHWQGLSGGLQTEMPIRWVCTLENLEYPGDVLSNADLQLDYKGIIDQDANKEKDSGGKKKSMYWLLENIAKSLGARIYQAGGRWNVERINDVVTGSYSYMECDSTGTITGPTLIDVNKTVSGIGRGGDYEFIREDAIVTVKPGVKRVIVTYKPQIFETILPNGDFELVNSITDTVLYWESLDDRTLIDPDNRIAWWNQLGVDTNPIPAVPGIYGESKYAVTLPIEPTAPGTTWGLLRDRNTSTGIAVPVDTSIWDTFTLQFKYAVDELNAGWVDPAINIEMWYIESNNAAHNDIDLYELKVYGYWQEVTDDSPIPINRVDSAQSTGDVVQVVFNNNGDISMPFDDTRGIQRGLLNGLTFLFALSSTIHRCTIDDIKLAPTSKKSEVWEVEQTGSTFTMEQEIEHEIGSAYTGFYWSNYTKSWGNTFRDFEFSDGSEEGTLSELLAKAVLRNNCLPSRVMQCSIKGPVKYGDILSFDGMTGKYMILQMEKNTEDGTTRVIAIEVRNDSVAMIEKHYGKT